MKDTFLPLRKSYTQALAGLVLDTKPVKVLDQVPKKELYPYVLLSTQTATPINNKRGCEEYSNTILLEIVTGYVGEDGGKRGCDLIADQIYQKLTPALPAQEGFGFGLSVLDEDVDDGPAIGDAHKLFIRRIRFRNTVNIF